MAWEKYLKWYNVIQKHWLLWAIISIANIFYKLSVLETEPHKSRSCSVLLPPLMPALTKNANFKRLFLLLFWSISIRKINYFFFLPPPLLLTKKSSQENTLHWRWSPTRLPAFLQGREKHRVCTGKPCKRSTASDTSFRLSVKMFKGLLKEHMPFHWFQWDQGYHRRTGFSGTSLWLIFSSFCVGNGEPWEEQDPASLTSSSWILSAYTNYIHQPIRWRFFSSISYYWCAKLKNPFTLTDTIMKNSQPSHR